MRLNLKPGIERNVNLKSDSMRAIERELKFDARHDIKFEMKHELKHDVKLKVNQPLNQNVKQDSKRNGRMNPNGFSPPLERLMMTIMYLVLWLIS